HRYTGQNDILVGSPATGRTSAEWAGVMGYFVNPLVLRANFSSAASFSGFLQHMRTTVLGALAHQDLPFFTLVERLQSGRDPSRSPLFQVMFTFENTVVHEEQAVTAFALDEEGRRMDWNGLVLESIALEQKTALFDVLLMMAEGDGTLRGVLKYNTDLFRRSTAERMIRHYQTLLDGIVEQPETPVAELTLLTREEREQVLIEWNRTHVSWPGEGCVHELFEKQAERMPDAMAVEYDGQQLSYRALNVRANQLANYLRKLGVGPEAPVMVHMERSLEMVVALMGILKAGGAYLPLDPDYPAERLACMAEDARAPVVVTHTPVAETLRAGAARVVNIDTDWNAISREEGNNPAVRVEEDNLAYVIYTSGSTGMPKGAMNTHGGLRNRLLWMQQAYGLEARDRVLQKTPFSFDVSVWEFFWPLMVGAGLVMAKPGGHQDPEYLGEVIAKAGVTTLHFVPSMLRVFLESTAAGKCVGVRRIISSGEALTADTAQKCLECSSAELHNLYGPTEASIDVTHWRCDLQRVKENGVPLGQPIANTQVYVLNEAMEPAPVGVAGELYLGGVGLARGYWRRAKLTAEKFVPNPYGEQPGARLYRTGDLVRWRSDGNLEFLGRLDQQVKVRGFRIELGEIETELRQHAAVDDVLVVAQKDQRGEQRLVGYVVGGADERELREYLKRRLPEYMVPSVLMRLERIPLTANGKIDRKGLPEPLIGEAAAYAAPRTAEEEILCGIVAEVLQRERVGVGENFFDLGGHSLLAVQVIARIRAHFGVVLPLRAMFEAGRIEDLARTIVRARGRVYKLPALRRSARAASVPLSYAQQRLWFVHQFEAGGASYNLPGAARIRGPLNIAALHKALAEIVRRHESLRTRFVFDGSEPRQVVDEQILFDLPLVDLSALAERERELAAEQRMRLEAEAEFDLASGPLLRALVLRVAEQEHLLVVTMHHIIADGWSLRVLVREAASLYAAFTSGEAAGLAELPVQYADYVDWQRQCLEGEALAEQLSYWQRQLAGIPAALELPTDFARPAVRSNRGAKQDVQLTAELTRQLARVSREYGSTLFMTLLAAFATLLYRYSGQQDIVIGSPVAGRQQAEVEGLIGFLVNTVALRSRISRGLRFSELLQQVKNVALDAWAHQDVPFEKIVQVLAPERDSSRAPLVQVFFGFENERLPDLRLGAAKLDIQTLHSGTAKVDLTLTLENSDSGVSGVWEYSTDLFRPETIARMVRHYSILLSGICEQPDCAVTLLPMLSPEERDQLVVEWNHTRTEFPRTQGVHQVFEQQVTRNPESVAVACGDLVLSYQELNRKANQLARLLVQAGVKPEDRVGVCMNRSVDMIAAVLGILKAGASYVPLDPQYPAERITYMMEDAGIGVLLMEDTLPGEVTQQARGILCIDVPSLWERIAHESGKNLGIATGGKNLAYLMYTSGSTGVPKGILVVHEAITRLVCNTNYIAFAEKQRIAQAASTSFDAATFEIWGALLNGGRLILLQGEKASLRELGDFIASNRITTLWLTAGLFGKMVEHELDSLRGVNQLLAGGDVVSPGHVARLCSRFEHCTFINGYGPTETTTFACTYAVKGGGAVADPLPIGKPIANTRVYILDREMQPVAIGVAGELYIGGEGLARGYLKRPDLTAEKFVPDAITGSAGERLYRTGDLARWRDDGNVEFLGRLDQQVKLRGFRVELGEIEAVLRRHDAVEDAAVLVREEEAAGKRLIACVASRDRGRLAHGELSAFLRARLPEYMVPSGWVVLEELPKNANGKVDRTELQKLPAWRGEQEASERARVSTAEEEIVRAIWEDVLGVHAVAGSDNFFELGGHSLLATQVIARIRQAFSIDLPLRVLFETPTAAQMAKRLREAASKAVVSPLRQVDRGSPLPLSYAQQR
ncbi:MAG TPA: amino acid adenylation domain-containing protein, partial [Acidobacteriaceae bacterium]|nr:amino acid adenylation domain-containing protein [Acidobacteriaceae bacterium]